ncbi:MAG: hypothetical protein IKV32_00670 [Muribaculaceae bacterium]|nr:hypothetical protein [Muribaculaceae bacterium]
MIKTKTFVVETSTSYNCTDNAVKELDDMINKFIEEKTAECTSFKVINIQYSPTIVAVSERLQYWYPSAMIVYDEA